MVSALRLPRVQARICAYAAMSIGIGTLVGWSLHIDALTSVFAGFVTMKPNNALATSLCGIALALLTRVTGGKPPRAWIGALGALVVLISGLSLCEHIFGWNFGIDQWLGHDSFAEVGSPSPGRMSPVSAYTLMLAGSAAVLSSRRRLKGLGDAAVSALATSIIAIGGMSLFGYLLGAVFNFHLSYYSGVAVQSATAYVLLGLGFLALVKSEGAPPWSLDRLTTGGFLIGVLLLLGLAGGSYDETHQLVQAAAWVAHTEEVLKEIQKIEFGVSNLGSSQRSYISTGSERMLEPYARAKAGFQVNIATLRRLTSDNPDQQRRLDRLEAIIATRIELGEQVIAERRKNGLSSAERMIATGTSTASTSDIRGLIQEMTDEEYSLLDQRHKRQDSITTSTFLLLPMGVFLSLTILSLGLFFLNAGLVERIRLELGDAQLAAIVSSSADAIIGKDLSGTVTSWNAGAERIFGYSEKEMLGQPIGRLIPADRKDEENNILDHLRRGESVLHFDTVRLRKDHSNIDISVSVSVIRDSAGNIIGASKVARDITYRKMAEATLLAAEDRYRTLFEYAPDGIVIADPESTYIDANASACRMLGYSHDELIGLNATDIVVPEEIQHIGSALDTIKSESDYHRLWQFRRKNGSSFWGEVMATMMPDGNLMGMIRDVTDRRAVEENLRNSTNEVSQLNAELEQRVAVRTNELEKANHELEAFSYSVSHDLRAPLRAVDGFSQAVLEDFGLQLPPEGRRQLQVIRESAQRMGELIDDLLAFSRLSRQSLRRQKVATDQLVRATLADMRVDCDSPTLHVTIGDLPPCEGDPALLKQVWVNLISNALKYSRKCARAVVEIGCTTEKKEHVFFVRDNGSGFDMRYADKLFGVFQRLHQAEDYEGTGVGLAIVKRIVNRHGGRVWADAAVDHGATFFFTLNEEPAQ